MAVVAKYTRDDCYRSKEQLWFRWLAQCIGDLLHEQRVATGLYLYEGLFIP